MPFFFFAKCWVLQGWYADKLQISNNCFYGFDKVFLNECYVDLKFLNLTLFPIGIPIAIGNI